MKIKTGAGFIFTDSFLNHNYTLRSHGRATYPTGNKHMLFTNYRIKLFYLLVSVLFAGQVMAETENGASLSDHKFHHAHSLSGDLTESGTDMFATIQEVIKKLSADPNTDWSKVNLEALRQHLRDMFEFSYNVDVISQQPLPKGVKIVVKPLTAKAIQALDKLLSAHPKMLKIETGWQMQSSKSNGQYQIIVTTAKPSDIDKIRGLGYIGLLAIGNHHQLHHWLMGKGQNPHQAMHH